MKHDFTPLDLWIIRQYKDIEKMNMAREHMMETYNNLIREHILNIGKQVFDNYEYVPWESDDQSEAEICYYKDNWKYGKDKWDIFCLVIGGYNYGFLVNEDNAPYIGLWTKRVKKFGLDFDTFNEKLLKYMRSGNKNLNYEIWDEGIYRELTEFPSLDKLAEIIEKEKLDDVLHIVEDAMTELKEFEGAFNDTLKSFPEIKKKLKL